MKYYKRDFDFNNQISQIEASALSTNFSQLREKINDCYDFYSLKQLSKDIFNTGEKLIHHIFLTNHKKVFEQLYKTRFLLDEIEFCQLQDYIFSTHNNRDSSPVIPHLEEYFFDVFNSVPKKVINPHYTACFYNYYELAKKSYDSNFFLLGNNTTLSILDSPDYAIFASYSTGAKPIHDFIAFAQHATTFNYFKTFLEYPEKIINNHALPPIIQFIHQLPFADHDNPRIQDLDVFTQLMSQEHWNALSIYKEHPLFLDFLNHVFFYQNGRPNSTDIFNYSNPKNKMLHFIKYSTLQTIYDKNIDLSVLFNEKTQYKKFQDFFDDTLSKKHIPPEYSLDQEGVEHAQSLLKKQYYFEMTNLLNNRLKPRGFDSIKKKI